THPTTTTNHTTTPGPTTTLPSENTTTTSTSTTVSSTSTPVIISSSTSDKDDPSDSGFLQLPFSTILGAFVGISVFRILMNKKRL
ncbi:MAG: hypothetical protein ACW99Q_10670, partial [Candidatus Kariarchaeaceae archaeon]